MAWVNNVALDQAGIPSFYQPGVMKERPGSGRVVFNQAGIVGERTFDVPWFGADGTSWLDVVARLVGKTVIDPLTLRPVLTTPDLFSSDLPWLICREVTAEPEDMVGIDADPLGPRLVYRRMILHCKYLPFEVQQSVNFTSQAYSVPGTNFAWTVDNNFNSPGSTKEQLLEPAALQFPMAEWSFERRQVLAPNFFLILSKIGKVNRDVFVGWPARTLLLVGAEARSTYLPNGTVAWNITLKFSVNVHEHLRLFRPQRNCWWYVRQMQVSNARSIDLGRPIGGSFQVIVDGKSTGDLPFGTTELGLTAALESLATVGANNVRVSGGPYRYSVWLWTVDQHGQPNTDKTVVSVDGSKLTYGQIKGNPQVDLIRWAPGQQLLADQQVAEAAADVLKQNWPAGGGKLNAVPQVAQMDEPRRDGDYIYQQDDFLPLLLY